MLAGCEGMSSKQRLKGNLPSHVGFRCSNPKCKRSTVGPAEEEDRSINIGVAAHITAASPNGPRYDSSLTSAERISASNGIWLCQNCAKLIDSDTSLYSAKKLRQWKKKALECAGSIFRPAVFQKFRIRLLRSSSTSRIKNFYKAFNFRMRITSTALLIGCVSLPRNMWQLL